MSPEFWAIIGVGIVLFFSLQKTNERLDEVNRRLQNFWEDIVEQRHR